MRSRSSQSKILRRFLLLLLTICSACTLQPPTIIPQPPTVTLQPPTITPQPPTVTPQPPTVTPPPPTVTPPPLTVTPVPPGEVGPWQPGQLEILLADVKHGDAQLIISPTGETLLIDGGEAVVAPIVADKIRTVLGKLEVDYLLASHYHIDHIGAVVPLLTQEGLRVRKAILDRGGGRKAYDSATYRGYYDYVSAAGRPFKHVRLTTGDKIDLGPRVALNVLAAGDSEARTNCGMTVNGKNDNDYSIVLWLSFGLLDYWTGGDLSGTEALETSNVEAACARLVPRPVDLMKANHHAISNNNNAALINALQPRVTLISLDGLGDTAAMLRFFQFGTTFATNRIIALAADKKTATFIDDSDDLIVTSKDGSEFEVEGKVFKSR